MSATGASSTTGGPHFPWCQGYYYTYNHPEHNDGEWQWFSVRCGGCGAVLSTWGKKDVAACHAMMGVTA